MEIFIELYKLYCAKMVRQLNKVPAWLREVTLLKFSRQKITSIVPLLVWENLLWALFILVKHDVTDWVHRPIEILSVSINWYKLLFDDYGFCLSWYKSIIIKESIVLAIANIHEMCYAAKIVITNHKVSISCFYK